MRTVGLARLLHTAMIAVALAAAGRADGAERGLAGKIEYCKTCHGLAGQGYLGYFAMPRLAGQQEAYLGNQLHAFTERRRTNPVMFNVAHALSPSMVASLAAHFRHLNPPPFGGGPRNLVARGKTIYEEGIPESNVPACSACHGPDGTGRDEIPRLAGQLYPYTVKALRSWARERGQGSAQPDVSAVMAPTAHNMNPAEISAVAAYVSTLR
ncbi:MAG TPA: c-type cytochrome [Xanthobacteraceae bacterium]|nr:c-type cytochrome [Xanthobacteraceae bacterium]